MSNGGFRPNSGRKKGSIPWNKGKKYPQMIGNTNGFKKGQPSWNKDKEMPETMRIKMKGNTNAKGNKKFFTRKTLLKMSLARIGIESPMKGKKHSLESRRKMRESRINYVKKDNPNYIPFYYDDRKRIHRERLLINGGCHSVGEWETLKAQYNFTCPSCKRSEPKIKLTRDHIIAVSRGGSDNIENIQPLCVSCNSRKSTQEIKY